MPQLEHIVTFVFFTSVAALWLYRRQIADWFADYATLRANKRYLKRERARLAQQNIKHSHYRRNKSQGNSK